jgi:hypothetical protein
MLTTSTLLNIKTKRDDSGELSRFFVKSNMGGLDEHRKSQKKEIIGSQKHL